MFFDYCLIFGGAEVDNLLGDDYVWTNVQIKGHSGLVKMEGPKVLMAVRSVSECVGSFSSVRIESKQNL